MKKIISILLILVFSLSLLVACGGEKASVRVAVLNGSTGFGMAKLMEDNANGTSQNNYTFSVETNGADVTKQLINGSIDIAALPTNAASTVYNKTNGGVKILALNTLGVLYVVENGNTISSIKDLEGKKIYCPAQNPEYILKNILVKNGIYTENCIDTSYAEPAALNKAVASGEIKGDNVIAVLPQPVLTTALAQNKSLRVALDLTSEWDKIEDTSLVQGCVVVRTEFLNENSEAVAKFLAEYKTSVEYLQENVEDTAKLVVKHGVFGNENVAKTAIPKCNVTFIVNSEMKNAMKGYLESMLAVEPSSIGGKLPQDDFYYISE